MTEHIERITSLQRTIQRKKTELGVETDLLTLKSLRKYRDLTRLTYPASTQKYVYLTKGRFEPFAKVSAVSYPKVGELVHAYQKIKQDLAKAIVAQLSTDQPLAEQVKTLNTYLAEQTLLKNHRFEVPTHPQEVAFAIYLFDKYAKKKTNEVFQLVRIGVDPSPYVTFDYTYSSKICGFYRGLNQFAGERVMMVSGPEILAEGVFMKLVLDYLAASPAHLARLQEKLSDHLVFPDGFEFLTPEGLKAALDVQTETCCDVLKVIFVLTFEDMMGHAVELTDFETRLTAEHSDYAKTYMTKKAIPKKLQAYMANNAFLETFGYVEVDESCELDKLQALSAEFQRVKQQLPFPLAKDHSLRFRRLGNHKALGIYFANFKTLAVDIHSPSSFIHEWFHLLDFTHDLLSFNSDFHPLLQTYRQLMDETVDQLPTEDVRYQEWHHGKKKHGRDYYRSTEEAFARMGELYVSDVLGFRSSFNKIEADYQKGLNPIVYPRDAAFLAQVQVYFERLFAELGIVPQLNEADAVVTDSTPTLQSAKVDDLTPLPVDPNPEAPVVQLALEL